LPLRPPVPGALLRSCGRKRAYAVIQTFGDRINLHPIPGELLISDTTPGDSRFCCDEEMRDLVILFIHLIATFARLLGPGGRRCVVAESVLVKQQLLILNAVAAHEFASLPC
jgi:hypothetical protein